MTASGEPRIDFRAERPYMGMRTRVPMRGMSKEIGRLRKEVPAWLKQHGVEPAGPPFLRYHVIDMAGEMDIELGK